MGVRNIAATAARSLAHFVFDGRERLKADPLMLGRCRVGGDHVVKRLTMQMLFFQDRAQFRLRNLCVDAKNAIAHMLGV